MATAHALTDRLLGGRYRLGSVVGRGGMAEVFDGFDERLDRPVAVKVLRPDMAARADVRRRFEDEARAAARLVHPNVVSVFDSGEDGTVEFLVMERLPGETMADRMRDSEAPLDTDWVLRVAGDVLLALGAAHAAGLVHRDVKPGNVLIASDGCAKVADFGIAKSLEVAGDLTSTNQLLGTPAYVAPERIEGKPATVQSDLYAVGVLLYEALAGVKPFSGPTPVAVAYAIRHDTPEPLASLRPDLPPALVAAVERAMAREPADRYDSARSLAEALGVAAGRPIVGSAGDETLLAADEDPTSVLPIDATAVRGAVAPVDADPTVLQGAGSASAAGIVVEGTPGIAPAPSMSAAERSALATDDHGRRPGPPIGERFQSLTQDRRRLFVVAAIGVVIALLLFGVAAAGDGDRDVSPARKALAADLHEAADDLGDSSGPAAGDAAEAMNALADKVEDGKGATEATALLRRLVSWRDGGGLTAPTADELAGLARRVPGVDGAAYTPATTTTAAPPPTQPPERPAPGGKAKGKKKRGDDD